MKLKKMISVGLIVGLSQAAWASIPSLSMLEPMSCSATLEVYGPDNGRGVRKMIQTISVNPNDEGFAFASDDTQVSERLDSGAYRFTKSTEIEAGYLTYVLVASKVQKGELIQNFGITYYVKKNNGSISMIPFDLIPQMKMTRVGDAIYRHTRISQIVHNDSSTGEEHRLYFQCNDKLKDLSPAGKRSKLIQMIAPDYSKIGS